MNNLVATLKANIPLFLQLFRFGIVGLGAAAIHFALVVGLVQTLHVAPLIANFFAFPLSFQASYWGHRRWTFGGTAALHRHALPKLLFVQAINFLANETLFYIFLALNLSYPVALLIVIAILPLFTFMSSKWWVFR